MTLQEQFLNEHGDGEHFKDYDIDYYYMSYIRWLESRIESLQSANQWVSVKDRLPKIDGLYLIFNGGSVHETYYNIEWNYWRGLIVTHWRELPAAPVKEGEG